MHEEPEIPNFAQRRKGIRLAAGMTLAIEPMITAGRYDVAWMDDGWTVVTEDGSLASHYEKHHPDYGRRTRSPVSVTEVQHGGNENGLSGKKPGRP